MLELGKTNHCLGRVLGEISHDRCGGKKGDRAWHEARKMSGKQGGSGTGVTVQVLGDGGC